MSYTPKCQKFCLLQTLSFLIFFIYRIIRYRGERKKSHADFCKKISHFAPYVGPFPTNFQSETCIGKVTSSAFKRYTICMQRTIFYAKKFQLKIFKKISTFPTLNLNKISPWRDLEKIKKTSVPFHLYFRLILVPIEFEEGTQKKKIYKHPILRISSKTEKNP